MNQYMERLLSNKDIYHQILSFYHTDCRNSYEREFLNEIQGKLIRYDNDEFYEYAKTHYLQANVHNKYVHVQITNSNENVVYPMYIYCIELFVHLHSLQKEYERKQIHQQLTNAEEVSLNIISRQYSMLYRFLNDHDYLIQRWIEDLEANKEESYTEELPDKSSEAIQLRLLRAISEHKIQEALTLLGSLSREIDKDIYYYLHALIYYKAQDYHKCIKFGSKVTKESPKYKDTVMMILESYACLADIQNVSKLLSHLDEIEMTTMRYIMMLLSLNLRLDSLYEVENIGARMNDKPSIHYSALVHSLAARAFMEAFELLDESRMLYQLDANFKLSDKVHCRLCQLQEAIKFYNYKYHEYINFDFVKDMLDEQYIKLKEDVYVNEYWKFAEVKPNGNFNDVEMEFMLTYRLSKIETFLELVEGRYDELVYYADALHVEAANEILRLAYVEGAVCEIENEELHKRFANDLVTDRQLHHIYQQLSPIGKMALDAAENNFKKIQEDEDGLKDAGLLALGYSRIFEVELQNKLFYPLMKSITEQDVRELLENTLDANMSIANPIDYLYTHIKEVPNISNNKVGKWNQIMQKYNKYVKKEKGYHGFTLGELHVFFGIIGFYYKSEDLLSTLIRTHFDDFLTEAGIEELNKKDGFFYKISNEDFREKFRNPPAHTRYMSFDLAKECRDTFITYMLEMTKYFK